MKFHAANLLALWLWLLCGLPWLERLSLYGAAILVLVCALSLAPTRLRQSLSRMRWLLLAVVAVYGWGTPGSYLWSSWLSPTAEGVFLGVEQALRLLIVALSLQILLTYFTKNDIVSGLFACLAPLRGLGLPVEHAALRLALTMAYAEQLLAQKIGFSQLLQEIMNANSVDLPSSQVSVVLPSRAQRLLLAGQFVVMVLTVLIGNYLLWN